MATDDDDDDDDGDDDIFSRSRKTSRAAVQQPIPDAYAPQPLSETREFTNPSLMQ